ncbi:hypothetical protein JCM17846_14780 [Iodidimonas nitroreducens]|uniref:Metalloprotease TldD/E N-terminal domain-containing protein n=1 Tax=Iodidimonas nitroreducens TaxID=1236968 RepID=A0A5A7N9Z3_9PROT|nr:DNA gyrase modulator [Iodidimonas nitroreducens]GER03796.1 hypothetical protein JCM17846_14780 [Iodidimonas nitroreducens]
MSLHPDFFYTHAQMDQGAVERLTDRSLMGLDDGELYLEYSQSEGLAFDDGRLKSASFDTAQGFGLRGVMGEATGYAHASELSEAAILRAAETIRAVKNGHSGHHAETIAPPPPGTNRHLYSPDNPLDAHEFSQKVALLAGIDAYARSLTAGWFRSRPPSPGAGRWWKSSAPAASGRGISGLLCGSMFRW